MSIISILILAAFIPQAGLAGGGLRVCWHGTGKVVVNIVETDFLYIRGIPDEVDRNNIKASIVLEDSPEFIPDETLPGLIFPVHVVTWYYNDKKIAEFKSSTAMQKLFGEFNWMSNSYKLIWSAPSWHDGKRYNIWKLFPKGFGYTHIGNTETGTFASTGMVD